MAEYIVTWTCKCGHVNKSDGVRVLCPQCDDCYQYTEWENILTKQQFEEMDAAIEETWSVEEF